MTGSSFAESERLGLVLDPQRCLHSNSIFAVCEDCFTVCPSGAIVPGKPPTLAADACAGCLTCVAVCPVDAYTARDAVTQLLNDAARAAGKTIEIACEKVTRLDLGFAGSSAAIQVRGCLAGLGTGAFLALHELGIASGVVRCEQCGNCEWGALFERICRQISSASLLSSAGEKQLDIRLVVPPTQRPTGLHTLSTNALTAVSRPVWHAHNRKLSRRDLFRIAASQGETSLVRDLEAEPVPIGKRLGRDRRRLKHLLSRQRPAAEVRRFLPPALGFTTLKVSDACTACQTCVRACPTGALDQHVVTEGKSEYFRLTFDALSCIGCGLCTPVCIPRAITLQTADAMEGVLAQRLAVVIEGALTRCMRCNVLFAARSGAKLCPTCDMRRKNPFTYRIPGQNN